MGASHFGVVVAVCFVYKKGKTGAIGPPIALTQIESRQNYHFQLSQYTVCSRLHCSETLLNMCIKREADLRAGEFMAFLFIKCFMFLCCAKVYSLRIMIPQFL